MLVPVAAPHPRILFCLVAFAMASRFSLVPFPPPASVPVLKSLWIDRNQKHVAGPCHAKAVR